MITGDTLILKNYNNVKIKKKKEIYNKHITVYSIAVVYLILSGVMTIIIILYFREYKLNYIYHYIIY